jgi:hypothetical protein
LITELEILTLAFAVLNFATYGLWWNKPLDVQVPFLIRDIPGDHEVYGNEEVVEGVVGRNKGWKGAVESVWDAVKSGIASVRKVPGAVGSVTASNVVEVLTPLKVFYDVIDGGNDAIEPRSKRVGTFYAGNLSENEEGY